MCRRFDLFCQRHPVFALATFVAFALLASVGW